MSGHRSMPFALLLIYAYIYKYIYIYMHPQYSTNTCPNSDLEIGNLHSLMMFPLNLQWRPCHVPSSHCKCSEKTWSHSSWLRCLKEQPQDLVPTWDVKIRSCGRCWNSLGKNTQVQGILYVLNKLNLGAISLAVLVQYYRPRSIWMDVFGWIWMYN